MLVISIVGTWAAAQQTTPDDDHVHEVHKRLPQYNSNGPSLRQNLISSGKHVLEVHSVADRGLSSHRKPETDILQEHVCGSTAIIVGTPVKVLGLLSNSETNVFTDYQIKISAILRNVGSDSLVDNSIITLTRPFGEAHLDEGTIRTTNPDYPALQVGAQYILFLQAIPGQHTDYQSVDDLNTYLISDDHTRPLAHNAEAESRAEWLSTQKLAQFEGMIANFSHSCR